VLLIMCEDSEMTISHSYISQSLSVAAFISALDNGRVNFSGPHCYATSC
jgi:hypothetical protein